MTTTKHSEWLARKRLIDPQLDAFLAGHLEEVGEDHKVAFDSGGRDLFEAAVMVAGDVHATNAGHDPLRQGGAGPGRGGGWLPMSRPFSMG